MRRLPDHRLRLVHERLFGWSELHDIANNHVRLHLTLEDIIFMLDRGEDIRWLNDDFQIKKKSGNTIYLIYRPNGNCLEITQQKEKILRISQDVYIRR